MSVSSAALEDQKKAIAATIEFMRGDLAAPVTLRDLADFASYSPYHFNRVFRNAIGVPPAEFRAALRFDWAKHLLLTTDLSITDVCYEVGFDSLGTFSARFSELVGVGPKLFRRLPDLIEGAPSAAVMRGSAVDTMAAVAGTVTAPGCGPVYLGLFPDRIARCRPIAGAFLPEPGKFEIAPIPIGTFRLLAAGFPPGADISTQLLPGDQLCAGSSPLPVIIRAGNERVERHITIGSPGPHAPPVLVALPPLVSDLG